ncbi:MAG: Gfo/Idh/MocA family oxidoreductase [Kurthia sp.]|nr:Gfo/Idh/MocA family oxidoreductase [Candidatus Kurthia equi]
MKWGIMSAANIAFDEFVPALRRSKTGIAYAIASHSPKRMSQFHIATQYDSYEDLLEDSEVDAVYIALPNALHHKMVILALEAGKHVLVEKPATISLNEMREISVVARRTKKQFLEGYTYQHHKQHEVVQRYLPKIGDMKQINAHISSQQEDASNFRLQRDLGGGAMNDVGGFCMHVITQLLGFQPKKISLISNGLSEKKVDLTSSCTMMDANGKLATFTCSMEMPFSDYYEVIGVDGSIKVTNCFHIDSSSQNKVDIELFDSNGVSTHQEEIMDDPFLRQIEYFEQLTTNPEHQKLQIRQSLDMAYYIDAAYHSALEDGKLINLSSVYSM